MTQAGAPQSQVIQVKVKEAQSSGLLVTVLSTGGEGFIPARELSWDQRVNHQPPIPQPGDILEVVFFEHKSHANYDSYSLRRTTDPWAEARGKYQIGKPVRGEVVSLRRFAAFVQIEPGITARVYPGKMPIRPEQFPEDILTLGDQVMGTVIDYDDNEQRCEISLNDYLLKLPMRLNERLDVQVNLLRKAKQTQEDVRSITSPANNQRQIHRPPMSRFECILVVDNDPRDCQEIKEWLLDAFGSEIEVVIAHSLHEALDRVGDPAACDLAIIDVDLAGAKGMTVAEELLRVTPGLHITFTSANPNGAKHVHAINGRMYPFAFKHRSDLVARVEKEKSGSSESVSTDSATFVGRGTFVQQLEMDALTRRPLPESLQRLLISLLEKTQGSYAAVLEADSLQRLAHITAFAPQLKPEIAKQSLDGLYYSPLREVVEAGSKFRSTRRHEHDSRFRYFFPLLSYRACYGTPLTIPGFALRYALFLMDDKRETFQEQIVDDVEVTAAFVRVALERALLLDFMHRYEERYSHGQLLGSLVHELRTKIGGLDSSIVTLQTNLPRRPDLALEKVGEIRKINGELLDLVISYSRVASGKFESVKVNDLVTRVGRQLGMYAKEADVKIHFELQSDLPPANAIQSRLEQVVLNVVLNAVQQIQHQAETMAKLQISRAGKNAILQGGIVFVRTTCNGADPTHPIRIEVLDTGPGIHSTLQDRIFLLDTSTRETGHGLGLFISRNIMDAMGGSLTLAGSIMFVGSLFVIEIPQHVID